MVSSRSWARHARVEAPSANDSLGLLLGRAYLNYTTLLKALLDEIGLSEHLRPGMGPVLFALFDKDGVTLSDVVARTGLAPSSVTEVLNRLERAGLVVRERDAVDRRSIRLTLTTLARSLEGRCRQLDEELHVQLEAGLSKREAQQLKRLLARVIGNLHAYFTTGPG